MKKNKAITLIALIVTIIVLLILAGVSISMLTGYNGILSKSKTAKENSDAADIEEKNKLGKYNDMMDSYITSRSSISNQENYSLEEKEIGTWVDGKTLYQKTVQTGAIPSGYSNLAHNILNIDQIIYVNGMGQTASGVFYAIPFSDSTAGLIYVTADKTNVTFWTDTLRASNITKIYMTLKYTKTT